MFWITLIRATIAMVIGLTIWLSPDFARPKLATFMGLYWLLLGGMNLIALHRGVQPGRLLITAGVVAGLVTGLAIFVQTFLYEGQASIFTRLVGAVILFIGMLHFLGGFRLNQALPRWRPGQPLGVVEIALGSILVLAPLTAPTFWVAACGHSWLAHFSIWTRKTCGRRPTLRDPRYDYRYVNSPEMVNSRLLIGVA